MSIDEIIKEYIFLAEIHSKVDFKNRKSVHQGNNAIDKMTEIAKELDKTPLGINAFGNLLDIEKNDIKYYVAMDLLSFMNPSSDLEIKALSLIKDKIERENHLGYQYWLDDYKKRKKQN